MSAWTRIEQIEVPSGGVASIVFSSIPSTYTDLQVILSGRTDSSTFGVVDTAIIYFNTDTSSTANYTSRTLWGDGGNKTSDTTKRGGFINGATATSSTFGLAKYYIPNYTSGLTKSVNIDSNSETNAVTAYLGMHAWLWSGSVAIDTVTLKPETGGNFVQYTTATLYGITKGSSGGVTVS